jgi:hypothetical protein
MFPAGEVGMKAIAMAYGAKEAMPTDPGNGGSIDFGQLT